MKVKLKTWHRIIFEIARYIFLFFGLLGLLRIRLWNLDWPDNISEWRSALSLVVLPLAVFCGISVFISILNWRQSSKIRMEEDYLIIDLAKNIRLGIQIEPKALKKLTPKSSPIPSSPPVQISGKPNKCLGKLAVLAKAGKLNLKSKDLRHCVTNCPKLVECIGPDYCFGLLGKLDFKKMDLTDPKFDKCRKCDKVVSCLGILK